MLVIPAVRGVREEGLDVVVVRAYLYSQHCQPGLLETPSEETRLGSLFIWGQRPGAAGLWPVPGRQRILMR